jgi:hypothetical protein
MRQYIALYGERDLEEAMDLPQDRQRNERTNE